MSDKISQIDLLANFILDEYPECIIDGGEGDVAIEIIKAQAKLKDRTEALIKNYKSRNIIAWIVKDLEDLLKEQAGWVGN